MPKLPALRSKEVIAALERAGFYKHHQVGSHVQLKHSEVEGLRVTIARHDSFELPPHIISSILKQAGLSREEFLKLLKKKR